MTVSPLQDRSQSMFDLYDTDGNGRITLEDFQQRAARIVDQFPQAAPHKAQAVRQQYAELWQELAEAADSDGDGQVTREEFVAVLDAATTENVAASVGHDMAEFNLADADDDGYIGQQEIVSLLKAYGVSAQGAEAVLAIVDTDGDGRISGQEFAALQRECYVATDPNAPGSEVFSRLSSL
ncbi:EF-hand domain-containing protein [Streptomyces sp. SP18CS02]|uniref:EF-hand domain-containing protein n=1 Tax=Streptomyces sp. SP18CS02 TaxID=3002531 RepID=UPI002E7A07E1|nr:EF-hand domain-containing protein [Streptomyces sp. SP18CS02]MEE1751931.1 EF-hand domain-containing protein [Streptomyces sp. SP18CS02]